MIPLIEQLSTPIDELRNNPDKSYRWLMDNTYKMLSDYGYILSDFIENTDVPDGEVLHEYLDWVYCECRSNYRFRYMIVSTEDDYILVPFKVIDPRSSKIENYFSISYPPISYNSMSTDSVLSVLKLYPSIKSMMIFLDHEPDGKEMYMRCNYFNDISQWEDMKRGKWKSKHGINILSELVEVNYNDTSDTILYDADNLFNAWCVSRSEKLGSLYGTYMKKTLEMALKNPMVNIISFRFRGVLVGYSIGNVVGNKFYFCNECKSIVFDDLLGKSSDINVSYLKKYLGSFMQYHLHEYAFDVLRVGILSYYGVLDSNKDLKVFKKKYYKRVCYYDRIAIER